MLTWPSLLNATATSILPSNRAPLKSRLYSALTSCFSGPSSLIPAPKAITQLRGFGFSLCFCLGYGTIPIRNPRRRAPQSWLVPWPQAWVFDRSKAAAVPFVFISPPRSTERSCSPPVEKIFHGPSSRCASARVCASLTVPGPR